MEAHPELTGLSSISLAGNVQYFPEGPKAMAACVRAFGPGKKESDETYLTYRATERIAGFVMVAHARHDEVCKGRKVTETVMEKRPVGDITWEEVPVTKTRIVWDCPDSLLMVGGSQ